MPRCRPTQLLLILLHVAVRHLKVIETSNRDDVVSRCPIAFRNRGGHDSQRSAGRKKGARSAGRHPGHHRPGIAMARLRAWMRRSAPPELRATAVRQVTLANSPTAAANPEQTRLDLGWEALNRQREKVDAERAELAALRSKLEAAWERLQAERDQLAVDREKLDAESGLWGAERDRNSLTEALRAGKQKPSDFVSRSTFTQETFQAPIGAGLPSATKSRHGRRFSVEPNSKGRPVRDEDEDGSSRMGRRGSSLFNAVSDFGRRVGRRGSTK